MNFINSNQVWAFVDVPNGITPIARKQIFKKNIGAQPLGGCWYHFLGYAQPLTQ